MEIYIRECRVKDYRDISLLNKNEMGYDFPEVETKRQLKRLLNSKAHKIYVATVEGRVVGYIHANNYDLSYSPHIKNIIGIAVSSNFRKSGIGKMLLVKIEGWAMKTGARGVRLTFGATREDAHAFYIACGYHCCKEQKNFVKLSDN